MSPVRRECGGPGTLIFRVRLRVRLGEVSQVCPTFLFSGSQARWWGLLVHKPFAGAGPGLSEDFQVRSEISSIFTGLYIQIKPLYHGLNLVHQGKRGIG